MTNDSEDVATKSKKRTGKHSACLNQSCDLSICVICRRCGVQSPVPLDALQFRTDCKLSPGLALDFSGVKCLEKMGL